MTPDPPTSSTHYIAEFITITQADMSLTGLHSPARRESPFARNSATSSPGPQGGPVRPKSAIFSSSATATPTSTSTHAKHHSISTASPLAFQSPLHIRNGSTSSGRSGAASSSTFAPTFIKSEEMQRGADQIRGQEGDNDFSGKRYVWLKDPTKAFVRGYVVEESGSGQIQVQCDDGSVRCTYS